MSTFNDGKPVIFIDSEDERFAVNQQIYFIDKQMEKIKAQEKLLFDELTKTISELEQSFYTTIKNHQEISTYLDEKIDEQQKKYNEIEKQLSEHETLHDQHISQMESIRRQQTELNQLYNETQTKNEKRLTEQQQINEKTAHRFPEPSEMNNPIISLFHSLPLNYPLKAIYLNGLKIDVSNYIKVEQKSRLVYFLNNKEVKTILSDKIDGIKW